MKQVRLLNEHGEPVCLHCGSATNAAYAGHGSFMICWKCGQRLSYDDDALRAISMLTERAVPEMKPPDERLLAAAKRLLSHFDFPTRLTTNWSVDAEALKRAVEEAEKRP